ncbi:MAG TPA: hypothetical protein VFL99_10430 [Segeticoccus sp.]|uniref:hypothetical protein n=1 Tax=Segeticoccus sp. TaxID=2706531 RepID=UPI002D80E4B4|nr:hypothetical protein [Segeticoccus sp.]HET8600732.1 hypothetical protein [Segeticoccus sp.]
MKRSPTATARRTVRRALTWRPKQDGVSDVSIRRLISPLRYDVVVRAQFFDLLESRYGTSRWDVDGIAREATSHPYHVWFTDVAMARFRPWVLTDGDLLASQFAERVRRSMALWTSYRQRGFDTRQPVTLRVTQVDTLTDTGVELPARLHVGDGGHRLAVLLASGRDLLEPAMYRVDPRPFTRLIDNTAILLPSLQLTQEQYARFVAPAFMDRSAASCADVLTELAGRSPGRHQQARDVFRAHGMLREVRP